MDLIERDGFWWPADDDWCWRVIHDELPDLEAAVRHCRGREVALQAGGNVGVWASWLARSFGEVHTIEPDPLNYQCLVRNVPVNVRHRLGAFGDRQGTMGMSIAEGNAGAHYMAGPGGIPVVTIDSLGLTACDLICLDVEGYEPFALKGAEATIKAHSPVILFEEKGLSERHYGISAGTSERWLSGLGYRVVEKRRADVVMVR